MSDDKLRSPTTSSCVPLPFKNRLLRKIRRGTAPTVRLFRKLGRFLKWVGPNLFFQFSTPASGKRSILVIHDTRSQPFSLGDILIAQEAALILCQRHQVAAVDFALLYDAEAPAAPDPAFAAIVQENAFYHLASILPIAQVNPYLGSLYLLDDDRQLNDLITNSTRDYEIWPDGWRHGSREYLSIAVFNKLLREHFSIHGSIPELTCRPFLRQWANTFFNQHAPSRVPVTINIRNNKQFHLHRNSKIEEWLSFIRQTTRQYPVTFIIICAQSEIDERFRTLSHVVLAKDHGSGIEQDMALIQGAAIHMGAGSGPATMAWFNTKPYLMVNIDYRGDPFFQHTDMIEVVGDELQRFWFAQSSQHVGVGPETADFLMHEFDRMWKSVDQLSWTSRETAPDISTKAMSWLR